MHVFTICIEAKTFKVYYHFIKAYFELCFLLDIRWSKMIRMSLIILKLQFMTSGRFHLLFSKAFKRYTDHIRFSLQRLLKIWRIKYLLI